MDIETQNSDWHAEALQAWGEGKVETAEFFFSALLASEPNNYDYLIGKSHCRFALKDYSAALGLARGAFGASYRNGDTRSRKTASILIGASYAALENPQGIKILEKVKDDHPDSVQDTSFKIALLLARAEKFEAALPYIEDTLSQAEPKHCLLASEIYYGLRREWESDFMFRQSCEISNGTTREIVSYLRASFEHAQLNDQNAVQGRFAVSQLQGMAQTTQPA